MNKSIKVLYVITSTQMGGAQMMLFEQLKNNLKYGVDNYVISISSSGVFDKKIKDLNIPIVSLSSHRTIWKNNIFYFIYKLSSYISQIKPDIIHSSMIHANFLCSIAVRLRMNVPIIWSIHNSDISIEYNKITTLAVSKICAILSKKIPFKIVYCSEHARNVHERFGYDKIKSHIIHNGIDCVRFSADKFSNKLRSILGVRAETFIIGSVGRFHKIKDYPTFFAAAGIFHKLNPEVHFVLVGDGLTLDNHYLLKLIEENDIKAVTHLLGRRTDINKIIASLNISVNTSFDESFSLSMAESMASEVPCVSSDINGVKMVMGNKIKYANVGNALDFSNKLDTIYKMSIKQRKSIGVNARLKIKNNYTVEKMTDKYLQLYDDIFNNKIY
jgi:glycosyltransferase involved in cell wall biosynthesis